VGGVLVDDFDELLIFLEELGGCLEELLCGDGGG